jgi:hypothetical protein
MPLSRAPAYINSKFTNIGLFFFHFVYLQQHFYIKRCNYKWLHLQRFFFPLNVNSFYCWFIIINRFQWPSGRSRKSVADGLLELRVRNPPAIWIYVSFECCVLSGRGLWDGPMTRPEESYRLWCVTVCGLESSRMRRAWSALGCCAGDKIVLLEYRVMASNRGGEIFIFWLELPWNWMQ